MNCEIINTGTELMLGAVANTNQQWLCRELAQRGFIVTRQVAVGDRAPLIQEVLREALHRAELVICTGGLGPTSDDVTRECVAELLGCPLREDVAVLASIEQFFRTRNRPMPARTRIQAQVPENARILPNRNGTAPGLALEVPASRCGREGEPGLLVMLPGPPRELEPMFLNEVAPLLEERFPRTTPFACRILRSSGLGESAVEERIARPLAELTRAGLEVGYCARFGEVDVRLMAQGATADSLVSRAEATVRETIGEYIYGCGSEQLNEVIVRELTARGQTLAVAESCTGGFIAHRVTNVPGASAIFLGGFITYSNEAKQSCLGVSPAILAGHGAVSEPTARAMAEGARTRLKADYALAVTGIAGPTGGSLGKPVGTVYIGLAGGGPTLVRAHVNRYDRQSFKFVTSQQALELLRRRLVGLEERVC